MITLFPDTGIHFLPLHYCVFKDRLKLIQSDTFNSDYIFNLLKQQWTPITFDGHTRDYARLYWRLEVRREGGVNPRDCLRPVLAIDTTLGDTEEGFMNDGYLEKLHRSDYEIEYICPSDRFHKEWFLQLHKALIQETEKINPEQVNTWKDLKPLAHYQALLDLTQQDLTSPTPKFTIFVEAGFSKSDKIHLEKGDRANVAGLFRLMNPQGDDISVNLYLDLGNTRSVGVFYEKNDDVTSFSEAVFPVAIVNYQALLKGETHALTDRSLIFSSKIEFREPIFPDKTQYGSNTFQWPSIACFGSEAQTLAGQPNNKSFRTGVSGPKRYLWDSRLRRDYWRFSTGDKETTIQGLALKYISPTDVDVSYDEGLSLPPEPRYPRRVMTTFFIIELLQQVWRQINSHGHRLKLNTYRKRVLDRIIITYPSGLITDLQERYRKQVEKAANIFTTITGCPPITVTLGLDEASASQTVFLESQLQKYEKRLDQFVNHLMLTTSSDHFRIASIDIGGGTTDMMVAEYSANDINQLDIVEGEILLLDSTSIGGDDLVKDLIEQSLIPALSLTLGLTDEAIEKLFYERELRDRDLRLRFLNLVILPLSYYVFHLADQEDPITELRGSSLTEKLKEINKILYPSPSGKNQVDERNAYGEALLNLDADLRSDCDCSIQSMHTPLLLPDKKSFEKLITNSALVKSVLSSYARIINTYSPSFVLLAGKISGLPVFRKKMQDYLVASPDRVIALSEFAPGDWYPFRKKSKIKDSKTTVIVGTSVSDIARDGGFTEGCRVFIRQGKHAHINYVGAHQQAQKIGRKDIIFNPDSKDASQKIPLTTSLNIIYRNINDIAIPCNALYRLDLKKNVTPDRENRPYVTLQRDPKDRSRLKIVNWEGNVVIDETPVPLNESHTDFFCRTMYVEDYYLDTALFSPIGANFDS